MQPRRSASAGSGGKPRRRCMRTPSPPAAGRDHARSYRNMAIQPWPSRQRDEKQDWLAGISVAPVREYTRQR